MNKISLDNDQNNLSIIWSKYNFDNTNEFSLNNKYLECRVVDIYDGDTCTCVLPLFGNYYKFKVRLADIDTCEIKSNSDTNKNLANKARICLYNLVTNSISNSNTNLDSKICKKNLKALLNEKVYLIRILCGEFDKYGRLLGYLFSSDENKIPEIDDIKTKSFNYKLINEHLAYFYKGDTKLTEQEQLDILNNRST
jgi:endonuclease YncB( thermonuclease family)